MLPNAIPGGARARLQMRVEQTSASANGKQNPGARGSMLTLRNAALTAARNACKHLSKYFREKPERAEGKLRAAYTREREREDAATKVYI